MASLNAGKVNGISSSHHWLRTPGGQGLRVNLEIDCPLELGSHDLGIEFVQEGVAWQRQATKNSVFISALAIESRSLVDLSTMEDRETLPDPVVDLLSSGDIPQVVRQASLGAYRLLEASRRSAQATEPRFILSHAGSQYPMFWVRDLATIQDGFFAYMKPQAAQDRHWSELFFAQQSRAVGVPDWVALSGHVDGLTADKNSVSSDQELWLADSVLTALEAGFLQPQWLLAKTDYRSHAHHLEQALGWLTEHRLAAEKPCITHGHTIDWGDVGPIGQDSTTSTKEAYGGARVCSTYVQALFVRVSKKLLSLAKKYQEPYFSKTFLDKMEGLSEQIEAFVQGELWSESLGAFRMHLHLDPSDIACDPEAIFALGAQVLAYEAGFMDRVQMAAVSQTILKHQAEYGYSSISGVLFPAFESGVYENPIMQVRSYQNGGQWDWFGARAIAILSEVNPKLAQQKLAEIAKKVVSNGTFYEWEKPDGSPGAGPNFRAGAAAFLSVTRSLYQESKGKQAIGSVSQKQHIR